MGAGGVGSGLGVAVRGDVVVKCYQRHRAPVDGRESIFSVQFHTFAVTDHTLILKNF